MRNLPILQALCAILLLGACARPVADFSAADRTMVAEPVAFENESRKAVSYEWDFGDGRQSTEAEPVHRYFSSGDYTVVLRATDEKGRSSEEKKTLSVEGPPERCLILIETPYGNMIAELYDATPKHQDNFVKLVEKNYYDSLLFHRVIEGFMIQGGDPNSRNAPQGMRLGSGGPDYTIPAEFHDSLAHVRGALAAARTQNPQKRSSGSQFYIVQGRPVDAASLDKREALMDFRYPSYVRTQYFEMGGVPFLDQDYTVFGQVIEGLDVIDRIAAVRTDTGDRPLDNVWMKISLIR